MGMYDGHLGAERATVDERGQLLRELCDVRFHSHLIFSLFVDSAERLGLELWYCTLDSRSRVSESQQGSAALVHSIRWRHHVAP